jgi:streptomycin 6-kinase
MLIDTSQCERKIIDIHGQTGATWLARLPALLAECAARWSLDIQPPFPISSYNYVAPAVGPKGEPLVLKAGVPHGELWSEIDALLLFNGRGTVRLLGFDRELGVLLLERVLPGQSLWSAAGEAEQIEGLAGVLRQLWRPLPAEHSFRTIADLARGFERLRAGFDGGYGPFQPARVERAAALFRELTGGSNVPVLIHGDANPGNILRSERDGWLAIDPKGYAGHPLWDVATFLNDPPVSLCRDDLISLQGRRVTALAEAMGAPRPAVLAWAEAHAVLSGWWSFEDHGAGWETAIVLAEIYEEMQ